MAQHGDWGPNAADIFWGMVRWDVTADWSARFLAKLPRARRRFILHMLQSAALDFELMGINGFKQKRPVLHNVELSIS
jgi:hypothetical protein